MASFAEATAVEAIDSHTYSLHFSTTHASQHQPHTIALHLSFLRRTSSGPARLTIKDEKLGRRTSTIHVSLSQDSGHDRAAACVVGYLTQSNIHTETGITLPTRYQLHPSPSPLSSTKALRDNSDPNWTLGAHKHAKFRQVGNRVHWYFPRRGQPAPALADEWICFSHPGSRFTQTSLGYVVDQFPQVVEGYPDDEIVAAQGGGGGGGGGSTEVEGKPRLNWYPTVVLNLEVKKALPDEGVEWLFVRVRAKRIMSGRMDLEVLVLDELGDLVAISNHVCLVLSSERNLTRSAKKAVTEEAAGSKL
ncbi:MAG: hypothetical protein Q9190_000689 [Brigantiaea leucoxantha]